MCFTKEYLAVFRLIQCQVPLIVEILYLAFPLRFINFPSDSRKRYPCSLQSYQGHIFHFEFALQNGSLSLHCCYAACCIVFIGCGNQRRQSSTESKPGG